MSRDRAYLLSLGSNVEPARWVPIALSLLKVRFAVDAVSPAYDVGAVGDASQPRYVNLAVRLRTDLPLRALRAACRHVEMCCARVRGADRLAPRTLDLDVVYRAADGAATHPDLLAEGYVLVPCADVWPDAVLAAEGTTLGTEALARFPRWGAGRRMEDA